MTGYFLKSKILNRNKQVIVINHSRSQIRNTYDTSI